MEDGGRTLAPHQAAGRVLAALAKGERPLLEHELAAQTHLSVETIETVLEWLRELELVQHDTLHRYQLGHGGIPSRRQRFYLLLHLEPDPGLSSFCHALLAEGGYPSIGVETSDLARFVLQRVEFDLAVLSASGRSLAGYTQDEQVLLDCLAPVPIILYGTEGDGPATMLDSVAAILPGRLHGNALLAAVQALLPPERRYSSELRL